MPIVKGVKQNKSATIGKEQAEYLRSKPLLGGSQELEDWIITYTELHGCAPSNERIEAQQIEIQRGHYIVVDFETDTSTTTHVVNHANVDILITDEEHNYETSLLNSMSFNGYGAGGALDKFCDWLFSEPQTCKATVTAHNGSGYDFRFILKWCTNHGLHPDVFTRSGRRLMYMYFS